MLFEFFERQIDPLREVPLQRPPADTRGFFHHYLRPFTGVLLVTLLISGVSAITEIFLYRYLGQLVDWMADTPRDAFFTTHGQQLILMVVVIALIRPMALLASRAYINLALAPGIANATRWQNHRYVLRQSLQFFQNDFAGRVAQKVMQTGQALREAVVNVIDGVWLMVIYLVGISVLFSDMNGILLLPVIVWVVCYLLVIISLVPPVRDRSRALSEANSVLTGRIVDSYTNIQSVKLFAHAELEESFTAEAIDRVTNAFRKLMRSVLVMTSWLTLLNTLLIVSVAAISLVLWQKRLVSVGEIAVANGLIIRLNQMSGWILRTVTSLFENVGTVQNGIETIAKPQLIQDVEDADRLRVESGAVSFRDVSFNYGEEMPVINDFNLNVKAGEKVGLVGKSGAGKSTLVNLLMRFFEPEKGVISVDGTDIRSVSQDSLRQQIAVVTQDTSLLHRSIRDNIRYGRAAADSRQVETAARLAEAMEFIPSLTDPAGRVGFDAHVGERGVKLSGGQRQRIAIARVILKDAPILILDEATSALDSEVEAAIQNSLTTLMAGKTVIAVAHRLSTIASMDRLVVLDQGKIAEQGTHDELLALDGVYASLWHRQSGGFINAEPQ